MIKVLLIQNIIARYNLPIYNLLSNEPGISLTVAHYGKKEDSKKGFEEIVLQNKQKGPFQFSVENIREIADNYDVVICMGDIRWLSLMGLGRGKRKYKLIYWGIGVSASYKNKFDENKRWDFLRYYFMRKADALVFYSNYPVEKYAQKGFSKESLFVAHNTVAVNPTIKDTPTKDSILFVGTLYKEKGISELLEAYQEAFNKSTNLPILNIIGGGDELENISNWVKENRLENQIKLLGPIYDNTVLESYFMRAFACISPSQAGLSVLTSMAYGVPFITRHDAITGGERLNIDNNKTGILYREYQDLVQILSDIKDNGKKYITMGESAKEFYYNNRTPEHMVAGFVDAINYVKSK
ncbi:glycosyltransferase family 4 protein [Chitinophaga sp. Hz27]|uniref:glycosyltransferase family 4 protein n=1 Tax=Chitinophaga sp. Hz27 TaxID=3347169 RepID=UPI0035E2D2FA